MHPKLQNKLIAAVSVAVLLTGFGTGMYVYLEKWTLVDSLYFTTMTLTTVGYGDLVPSHTLSKLFTVFFAFAGVGIFLYSLTIITEYYLRHRFSIFEKRMHPIGKVRSKDTSEDITQVVLPDEEHY
ncbi:MAG: potassium channel family protein [Nanoarchaeota archaeon]